MTAIDPATCWVPVPIRWRYVQPGDVTVGLDGLLIPVVGVTRDHPLTITYRWHGNDAWAQPDPDELVPVLVPIPERDAGALTVEQLGAVVIGRRTVGGAA